MPRKITSTNNQCVYCNTKTSTLEKQWNNKLYQKWYNLKNEIGKICKKCYDKFIRKYSNERKKTKAAYHILWYEKNREKQSKSSKKRYEEKKDEISLYQKQYYIENKQKVIERVRKYYEDNKEYINTYKRMYLKTHPQVGVGFSPELRRAMRRVRKRDENKCKWYNCKSNSDNAVIQVNHIFPRIDYPELQLIENYMISYCVKHHLHWHYMRRKYR